MSAVKVLEMITHKPITNYLSGKFNPWRLAQIIQALLSKICELEERIERLEKESSTADIV